MPALRASNSRLPGLARALGTALLGLALLGGCSLGLPQTTVTMADRSLYLAPLENNTSQPDLVAGLAWRVTRAFATDGRLRTTTDPGHSDLRLDGDIQQCLLEPIRWESAQLPVGFRLRIAMDLKLTDVRSGKLLWNTQFGVKAAQEDKLDSMNTGTLQVEKEYYHVNSLGLPAEDDRTARDELLDQLADRIVKKVFTGF